MSITLYCDDKTKIADREGPHPTAQRTMAADYLSLTPIVNIKSARL